jgi:ATP-dependent DNA helicase PIF1
MLLRNLDLPELCNGTRLCVKNLYFDIIEATILTGCAKGKDIFIPRIPLIPTGLPFDFKRIQFPVRLAFAMSNKAQGQSLKIAEIHLQNPCFSHRQLYVACSRVGHPSNLHILAPGGKTRNIVYPAALQ